MQLDEYGTNEFSWGSPPAKPLKPQRTPDRHQTGGTRSYRIKPGESNSEFEARVNSCAEALLESTGAQWIVGVLRFKEHRYTEAVLSLYHAPVRAPIKRPAAPVLRPGQLVSRPA